ncbi:cysteine peptidase family C39 domain-containing protein, partial [Serratia sp. CY85266]|uniref:cysteine peptidase family C39 domain-containing protein n=1 Tax=Serratia sp. CY85266 TaxID=3383697 RepID=UPI003FA1311F
MTESYFDTLKGKLNLSLRRKVPQILQTEASECGLASLAMVCHYHGLQIDLFNRKRAARTVLTGMCYSFGNATRQGSSSLTRFIGQ